ncbi:MAG: bifunctional riboflavin kinase/FMN adenylyltransferase [Phycisphaerales bacterium]
MAALTHSGTPDHRSVLTIGTFDGVHRGHAELVRMARGIADAAAEPGVKVVAMVFDPHPLSIVAPHACPPVLMPFEAKAAHLRDLGADEVERLLPEPALLGLSPAQFLNKVAAERRPLAIVEGRDFCFGKNRAGDTDMLCALTRPLGIEARIVDPVEVVLGDHSIVRASSTLCRWLLAHGRVDDAARVLGRFHTLSGEVVQGDQRGRTIGFPTANLATTSLPPADGVYAARATLGDGRVFAAAVNVGERPTFAGARRTVEAFLIGTAQDAGRAWAPLPDLPEYGWRLQLELVAFLRDQVRFPGIEAFKAQLARDTARAGALVRPLLERTRTRPKENLVAVGSHTEGAS